MHEFLAQTPKTVRLKDTIVRFMRTFVHKFLQKFIRGFTAIKPILHASCETLYGVPFPRKRGKPCFAKQNTGCSEKNWLRPFLLA
jgi:hypothetical protein